MYLMEGTKLLDAHVFNVQQEIAKPIVTNFVFPCFFLVFCSFSLFYTYLELKKIYIVQQVFIAKKTAIFTGRKGIIVCMLYR